MCLTQFRQIWTYRLLALSLHMPKASLYNARQFQSLVSVLIETVVKEERTKKKIHSFYMLCLPCETKTIFFEKMKGAVKVTVNATTSLNLPIDTVGVAETVCKSSFS